MMIHVHSEQLMLIGETNANQTKLNESEIHLQSLAFSVSRLQMQAWSASMSRITQGHLQQQFDLVEIVVNNGEIKG